MASENLRSNLLVVAVGLVVNVLLAIVKLLAGIYGHSQALIADAIESFSDAFTSVIVWQGVQVAAAPADAQHPYGHGKAEAIAAVIVSVMLLASAGIIVGQSVRGFFIPREMPEAYTLWIILGVIVCKEILHQCTLYQARKSGSAALAADAWHHRSDAVTSLVAAAGVTLSLWWGDHWAYFDNVAAILAALVIGWSSWRILLPTLGELMDEAVDPQIAARITQLASAVPEVHRIEQCKVRKSGSHYLVDMHLEVEGSMSVDHSHGLAHTVKNEVLRKMPEISDVLIHIEPRR